MLGGGEHGRVALPVPRRLAVRHHKVRPASGARSVVEEIGGRQQRPGRRRPDDRRRAEEEALAEPAAGLRRVGEPEAEHLRVTTSICISVAEIACSPADREGQLHRGLLRVPLVVGRQRGHGELGVPRGHVVEHRGPGRAALLPVEPVGAAVGDAGLPARV